MDLAPQMLLFAKVVEEGGFSAAARRQGLTPSAISKQIALLEDRLGVRLLNRSTRKMTLTEEGHVFYERCVEVAEKIAEAEKAIVSLGDRPQGTLKVTATVAFGKKQIVPLLPKFLETYPDLRIALELTDRPVDLVAEEVDVAILFTEQMDDENLVARKIASNNRVFCAAPSYLETYGTPQSPQDLMKHNCLTMTTVSRWNDWVFDLPEGRKALRVDGNLQANSADAVYHATLAGIGVSRLSTFLISDDLKTGRLVRLLPDYTFEESALYAIFSDRRHLAPKIRAFVDHLVAEIGDHPSWER